MSTQCLVFMFMLMTLQHNLDLTGANSIQRQESQNVILDSTFKQEFKNCSTNSDCAFEKGQTCVWGACLCNRFGWISERYSSHKSRCKRITCKLQPDCGRHFGQGAYCSEHYCACATEIDPITQQCASPFMPINTKCDHDSTCEKKYGTAVCQCKHRTCVCKDRYQFSTSQQKCVPMYAKVHSNDSSKEKSRAHLYYMIAFVPLFLACVCVVNCGKGPRSGGGPRPRAHVPGQPTLVAIQAIALASLHKHSNPQRRPPPPSPPEVVIISQTSASIGENSPSSEQTNVVNPLAFPSNDNTQQNSTVPSSSTSSKPKLKPTEKPLDPPPNYIEALFESTKVELNLQQKEAKFQDQSPGSPLPPLYDSLAVKSKANLKS